jgi:hypothetical protein
MKVNEGEIPQYYVAGSHPAIISEELFDYVQLEYKRRKGIAYSGSNSPFANRVVCGTCGRFFGRKLWHSTDKYRCTVWQCNAKFKNDKPCLTPHIKEHELEQAFIAVFNQTVKNKGDILAQLESVLVSVADCRCLEEDVLKLDNDCEILEATIDKFIRDNARTVIDQTVYNKQYRELAIRYEALKQKRMKLNSEITTRKSKHLSITTYLEQLKSRDALLTEFDGELWIGIVEKVDILTDKTMVFYFKDGSRVTHAADT